MSMNVDKNIDKCRIKIRYPDGLEFEIEGPEEFVYKQKKEILSSILKHSILEPEEPLNREKSLERLIDFKENIPFISKRILELDTKMAILIILSAYKLLLNKPEVSALELSKALKLSGYNPRRIDRETHTLIKDKSIEAKGTKRTRKYILLDQGLTKATVRIFNIEKEQENKL